MALYYVNQGKTYKYEKAGGYIWSPKLNKSGGQNKGYNLMKSVKKGDYLFHNSGGKISAISVVDTDCKSGNQPNELKKGQSNNLWDDDGWIIYTSYHELSYPIYTSSIVDWMIENYKENSAFQKNGKSRLQYLCTLDNDHAKFLIDTILAKENSIEVKRILLDALSSINWNDSLAEKEAKTKNLRERSKKTNPNRVRWDKYEVALLIDTFWRIERNSTSKDWEIKKLSEKLRFRAVEAGMKIDETFRNYDGISMQLQSMAALLVPGRPERNHSKLFEEIATLYKTDKNAYKTLLREANSMVEDYYLIEPDDEKKNGNLCQVRSVIDELEDKNYLADNLFALLREESSQNPNGTTSTFLARKLKEPEINVKNILSISCWAKYEYGAYTFVPNVPAQGEIIAFDKNQSLTYTRPETIIYFGEEICEKKTWRGAYLTCCTVLYEDYPTFFEELANNDIDFDQKVLFKETNLAYVRIPKLIANNIYIELDLPARNIVSNIRVLLDSCNVDYENLVIKYVCKDNHIENKEAINDRQIISSAKTLQIGEKNNTIYTADNKDGDKLELSELVSNEQHNNKIKQLSYTDDTECRNAYKLWLKTDLKMAEKSCASYASAIKSAESFAENVGLSSTKLYTNNIEEAKETAKMLYDDEEFIKLDRLQHGRYKSAIDKLLQYYQDERSNIENEDNAEISFKTEVIVSILENKFPKGFRVESSIDSKKLKRYYKESAGEDLDISEDKLKYSLRKLGILYNDKVYMPDTMLSSELRNEIFLYIKKQFKEGRKALFYDAVFTTFSEQFLDYEMYNSEMLRSYLEFYLSKKYCFSKNYFSEENQVNVDLCDEIRQLLKDQCIPMKIDDICRELSYIPDDKIKTILGTKGEFVRNSKGEYFHVDSLDFTDEEEKLIVNLIEETISKHAFISGNELYEAIKSKYPQTFEKNAMFSSIGWRDALKYKLNNTFSFMGNIISKLGSSLSMSDVFADYSQSNEAFSLRELEQFAESIGTTIYFDSLYTNAIRISHEKFVSKKDIVFSVREIDKAIARFCNGEYIPLKLITEFAMFPDAPFPWTEYLLEQYVAFYSKKFRLLHANYNKNCAVGAIVKQESNIKSFDELLTVILSKSEVELKKNVALDYLINQGYLARHSYTNIEAILINARAKRNKGERDVFI